MRYMLMRKADAETEKGLPPRENTLQAMADYNERMLRAGVFVSGDGLRPTSEGFRIQFRDGEPTVTEGPFPESSEPLAGYTILEVESLEDAIGWAVEWPREDAGGNVTLELRRYFTPEDFEPASGLEEHQRQARIPAEMNVHLAFPETCREAMTFYERITGGHLEAMITHGETPAAEDTPPEWHDRIIHASLNIRGRRLMGADMAGDCFSSPQGTQVHLEYDDANQAEWVFSRLAEQGHISMPFDATFWAHRFGMVTDRFGVHWMISAGLGQAGDDNREASS